MFFFNENLKKYIYFFFFFFQIHSINQAQSDQYIEKWIVENIPYKRTITLNGFLDSYNTLTNDYSISGKRVFEPIKTIKITNNDSTNLISPLLTFNNINKWNDIEGLLCEIFENINTGKDSALSLWETYTRKTVHHKSPEMNNTISHPVALLGCYGYLTCGNMSKAVSGLAKYFNYESQVWDLLSSDGIAHSISEVKFDNNYVIIDPDVNVFYLDFDNETLVGRDEITEDNYLIYRTHHYGESRLVDLDVASIYNGSSKQIAFPISSDKNLKYNLRPGESIIFDYAKAKYYHHIETTPPSEIPWFISNSKVNFKPDFRTIDLNKLVYSYKNIYINKSNQELPIIYSSNLFEDSQLIIYMTTPFILLGGDIIINAFSQTLSDSITLDYSENLISWSNIWKSSKTGHYRDSIDIYDKILPLQLKEKHNYYLRFILSPKSSEASCGIDSLNISSIIQCSKFYLPAMTLGENIIEYSDLNEQSRNVEIEIVYQETTENIPPEQIIEPIFPLDGATVSASKFTFSWLRPVDADGDEIIDYEFQLSNRPDMKFPLSPTFHRYLSTLSNPIKPEFELPLYGLLNSDTEYFWRVRAKDSKDVWGQWSPIWSFNVNCVMMPLNSYVSETENLRTICWQNNVEGKSPSSFEIYGSNTPNGFIPDETNLIGISNSNAFILEDNKYDFYRIVAVDEEGNKSGPSRLCLGIVSADRIVPDENNEFVLWQNYPNPFNSQTIIMYQLNEKSEVILKIYDILGQEISCLVNEMNEAGRYSINFDADKLSSGIYIYSLQVNSKNSTKRLKTAKMILLK